uniref:Uncharacterized protein n=2 Tax=Ursus TaxID=9639 RepID=A0A452UD32_URSMA
MRKLICKVKGLLDEELLTEKMAVDGGCGDTGDWEGRWNHVKKFLERSGPFTHPDFEPNFRILMTLSIDGFIKLYVDWTLS